MQRHEIEGTEMASPCHSKVDLSLARQAEGSAQAVMPLNRRPGLYGDGQFTSTRDPRTAIIDARRICVEFT